MKIGQIKLRFFLFFFFVIFLYVFCHLWFCLREMNTSIKESKGAYPANKCFRKCNAFFFPMTLANIVHTVAVYLSDKSQLINYQ